MDLEQSNPEPGALGGAVGNEGMILQGETESDDSEEPETKITRCSIETSALPAVVSAADYAADYADDHDVVAVPAVVSAAEYAAQRHLAPVSADGPFVAREGKDTCNEQEEDKLCEAKTQQYQNRMRRLKKKGFVFKGMLDCTFFLKSGEATRKRKREKTAKPKYRHAHRFRGGRSSSDDEVRDDARWREHGCVGKATQSRRDGSVSAAQSAGVAASRVIHRKQLNGILHGLHVFHST
jgi:hypothetical protein